MRRPGRWRPPVRAGRRTHPRPDAPARRRHPARRPRPGRRRPHGDRAGTRGPPAGRDGRKRRRVDPAGDVRSGRVLPRSARVTAARRPRARGPALGGPRLAGPDRLPLPQPASRGHVDRRDLPQRRAPPAPSAAALAGRGRPPGRCRADRPRATRERRDRRPSRSNPGHARRTTRSSTVSCAARMAIRSTSRSCWLPTWTGPTASRRASERCSWAGWRPSRTAPGSSWTRSRSPPSPSSRTCWRRCWAPPPRRSRTTVARPWSATS